MSARPLVISDCDEVLLRMVSHFRDWLGEEHEIDFAFQSDFARALTRREDGEAVDQKDIWRLLNAFFDTEMDRQDPVEGAVEAYGQLAEKADVVILTNLLDHRQQDRADQLARYGIDAKVYTNQGPKGAAIARIIEEYSPSRSLFIDDLSQHHNSAREHAPDTVRLHLCGEPGLAPHIACGEKAGDAHARIDRWDDALPWILQRLEEPA
ncbi:HAD family hydrolase [Alteriqipengyuania sp.]|uniref:HAD family hydrolase n=1 Tax=Alteriqipengyuania sp. TaxID=2800692 RepID=UPI0035132869